MKVINTYIVRVENPNYPEHPYYETVFELESGYFVYDGLLFDNAAGKKILQDYKMIF